MLPLLIPLGLTALLAFYLAWNLGANDVANSMGTAVGAKALTLRQALLVAGVLEFAGAVLFGQGVSTTLATQVANSSQFADNPQVLLLGMVSVLLACGLWLQIATLQGLPVASSHSVVGAITGFSCVAAGISAVEWTTIGRICLAWIVTPLISGAVAALFYSLVKRGILEQSDPLRQLREWIPWLSAILLGIFGAIVLPTLFELPLFDSLAIPNRDLSLGAGAIAAISLALVSWSQLEGSQDRNEGAQEPSQLVERQLGRFQVLSACFVAFAHGSNDVGNAIAPLAAITYLLRTGSIPLAQFSIPTWILVIGGLGIVAGLAVQGKNVIATVGEQIISLQPSSGFCAELATASTILFASRLGLPVSTSHALVGGVVGIGLLQNWQKVRFQTVRSVALAWVITVPAAAILGAIIFTILRWLWM